MKILPVSQGSPEWAALRGKYDCASDAPAMMGASKNLSRSELVRMKATGDEQQFSQWARDNLLDGGHEIEAKARAIVEADNALELYPVTIVNDAGTMLASLDGLTMDGKTAWECKSWNKELVAAVEAGEVPATHYWQLEHQIAASDDEIERVIFTVSDGTRENTISVEYRRAAARREQLVRGWAQFREDVAAYEPVEVIPKAVAEPQMGLPAVLIEARGEVALVSNLDVFGERLKDYIGNLPVKPETDQDFANLEAATKVLQEAQDALEAGERAALARVASVDEMRRAIAMYRDLARSQRLAIEKLVKARKDEIRAEILREGQAKFGEHVVALNRRLGRAFMPQIPQRFAEAMKGKKTIESLRDAVATELARLKIEASAIADKIEGNLAYLREHAGGHEAIFADLQAICQKAPEDFQALVTLRIDAEEKRKAAELEAEREKIRREEEARAQALARTHVAAPREAEPAEAPKPASTYTPRTPYEPPGAPYGSGVTEAARPSSAEIVAVLARHFGVSSETVVGWLQDVVAEAGQRAIARMAEERAA